MVPQQCSPALAPGVIHHICSLHLPLLEGVLQLLPGGGPGQIVDYYLQTNKTNKGRCEQGRGKNRLVFEKVTLFAVYFTELVWEKAASSLACYIQVVTEV